MKNKKKEEEIPKIKKNSSIKSTCKNIAVGFTLDRKKRELYRCEILY